MSILYENCSCCGNPIERDTSEISGLCYFCFRRLEQERYERQREIDIRRAEEERSAEYERRTREIDQENSKSSCFISTAALTAAGYTHDAPQLNVLRKFRDNYIKRLPDGHNVIAEYYNIAPLIIEEIMKEGEPNEIFKNLYYNFVEPCYVLIINKQYSDAYELYCNNIKTLIEKYIIKNP